MTVWQKKTESNAAATADPAYNENAVRTLWKRAANILGDDKMNIFEEVKAAVDINTATEYYGLNVRKDTTPYALT